MGNTLQSQSEPEELFKDRHSLKSHKQIVERKSSKDLTYDTKETR